MKRKAQSGIGTLVVFISMILIAAIAAGVLIQTSSSVQSKALSAGSKASAQVSTAFNIIDVSGTLNTTGKINHILLTAKLAPGSDAVKLNDTVLKFDPPGGAQAYRYNSSLESDCNATGLVNEYNIQYLINGTNHKDGYMQAGDVVSFCFLPSSTIIEGIEISIVLLPKVGSSMEARFRTPDLLVKNREYLFP